MNTVMRCLYLVAIGLQLTLAAGCSAEEGEACERTKDCKSPLRCEQWTPTHEKIVGTCESDKCCLSPSHDEKLQPALQQARLEATVDAKFETCRKLNKKAVATLNKVTTLVEKRTRQNDAGTDDKAMLLREIADLYGTLNRDLPKIEAEGRAAKQRDTVADLAGELATAYREAAKATAVGKNDEARSLVEKADRNRSALHTAVKEIPASCMSR